MMAILILVGIVLSIIPLILYFDFCHVSFDNPDSWKLQKRIGMSGDMVWFVDRGVTSVVLSCSNDEDAKIMFDQYVADMRRVYHSEVEDVV